MDVLSNCFMDEVFLHMKEKIHGLVYGFFPMANPFNGQMVYFCLFYLKEKPSEE